MMTADEYRKRGRPAVDVEIAPGLTFKLRRPNLQALLVTGRLPTFFTSEVGRHWARTKGPVEAGERASEMNAEETREWMKFVKTIVLDVTVEPKLVEAEAAEGELSLFEIEDDHLLAIFNWAMTGAQGAPIQTIGGEVEAASLERFPEGGAGGAVDDARPGSASVLASPIRDVGAIG